MTVTRVHGPGSVASNSTTIETCTGCGVVFTGETYTDGNGAVTHQCTNPAGRVVCDDCA
jgi:hypothetical protein